jgi:hypothetical protein
MWYNVFAFDALEFLLTRTERLLGIALRPFFVTG